MGEAAIPPVKCDTIRSVGSPSRWMIVESRQGTGSVIRPRLREDLPLLVGGTPLELRMLGVAGVVQSYQ